MFCVLSMAPALAQDYGADARARMADMKKWDEMCAIEDCSQFPKGYSTYAIGPELYYFPTYNTLIERPYAAYLGSVRMGTFIDWGVGTEVLRSYGNSSLMISDCCHYLLTFFALADDFPEFPDSRFDQVGNKMPSVRLTLSPYNTQGRDNNIRPHLGWSLLESAPPSVNDVISANQRSYNGDFWLINVSERESSGTITIDVLSKRAILNDRHVFARCRTACDFHTVSFAEDGENTRAHISMQWMTLTGTSLGLCTPAQVDVDCDPSPDIFDKVPAMFGVIEDMFTAAQIKP